MGEIGPYSGHAAFRGSISLPGCGLVRADIFVRVPEERLLMHRDERIAICINDRISRLL